MKDKLPKAFLLFLLSVIAIETTIFLLSPIIISNVDYLIVQKQQETAKKKASNFDLIILGDSSANFGIDAVQLGLTTRLSCYNFATMANLTMAGNYFILKEYLKHNQGPKALILMATVDSWSRNSTVSNVVGSLSMNFTFSLPDIFLNQKINKTERKTFFNEFAKNILPAQRYRYEIDRILKGKDSLLKLFANRQDITIKNLLLKSKGNYSTYIHKRLLKNKNDRIQDLKDDFIDQLSFMTVAQAESSQLNYIYLTKIINLAEEKEIKIFLVMTPVFDKIIEREEAKKYINSYKKFLHLIENNFRLVKIIIENPYPVDISRLSHNVDHLNETGAREFAVFLGKRINLFIP